MRKRTAVPRTTGKSYHNNITTQKCVTYIVITMYGVIGDKKKKYESVSCFEDYNVYRWSVHAEVTWDKIQEFL